MVTSQKTHQSASWYQAGHFLKECVCEALTAGHVLSLRYRSFQRDVLCAH